MTNRFKRVLLSTAALLVLGTAALANTTLRVGASPVPHAELLNAVKDKLAKEGVDLKVVEMTDYVTPNLALADGEIEANFMQHKPHMDAFCKEKGLKLVSAGEIHVEPLGAYSEKIKSVEAIPEKAVVAIPSDPSNGGRALILLHNAGLITLNDPTDLSVTEFDVVKNPKKLNFKPIEAAQLPRVLKDVDLAVINGNYALEAGLSPAKDTLFIEGKESQYANIIAVREGEEKQEDIVKLINALQSPEIAKFINDTYNGGVVPAF